MASKSRWANDDEDAQLEAQRKREKEEKKRAKAEKARQLEEQKAAAAAGLQRQPKDDDNTSRPPSKRRRLSPERETQILDPTDNSGKLKLLRFEGGTFGKCRSVENYDKLNDIEEGAYGWVARAKERDTGKVVALKRLKIDPKDRSGLPVTGLREIQILKDCDHRNIVKLREVVVGDDTSKIEKYAPPPATSVPHSHPKLTPHLSIFLVLEFLEHDLKSILESQPQPFLASEVKTLLLQLSSGLAHLHSHYILHRDLKTSNLLLSNRGRLKIADFGMARYVGDPPPANLTSLVVTLWYRAPELLLGASRYSSPVDLWSVGCIFGELLAGGEPLLQGKNEVDELTRIFALCGLPSDETWPGFRRLPHARALRLPPKTAGGGGNTIRARFPMLTAAGVDLLSGLLALDPERRPTASEVLEHEYFRQDPRPKQEAMFPTYPSKAGQERRRKRETPLAPTRGRAVDLGAVDFSGIFEGREKEEKGGGFSLRMV